MGNLPKNKASSQVTGTGTPVITFLKDLDHPLKKEIEAVRRIILDAQKDLTEHIKWKAPSFCYMGDDRITFNLPPDKKSFRLIFHCGARAKSRPGGKLLLADESGLLSWADPDRAIARFSGMEEVIAWRKDLARIVREWIRVTKTN